MTDYVDFIPANVPVVDKRREYVDYVPQHQLREKPEEPVNSVKEIAVAKPTTKPKGKKNVQTDSTANSN